MRKIVQGAVLLVAISGGAAAQTPSPPRGTADVSRPAYGQGAKQA
jgi:hypothetical protein